MPSVKRLQFSTTVAVSPAQVIELMIGSESYRQWTSVFAEGSYFEGSWEKGQKIKFLSLSGDGMVAEIAEHTPNAFISIRHLGFIAKGVEDTESEAVRAWAPAYENYTFVPTTDGTRVVVDQDVAEEWESHLAEAWPKALAKLKALCERGSAA
jgi:hypothetical protein